MKTKWMTIWALTLMLLLASGCSGEIGESTSTGESTQKDTPTETQTETPNKNYIEQNK